MLKIKIFLLLLFLLVIFSCGYVGDPVAPEFLVPDSVKFLQANFDDNENLIVSWRAPDRKKNGDNLEEDQIINYLIYEARIKDDIKNKKLKFSDFTNIANLSGSATDKIVFKLNKFDLNERKALVVVPIFKKNETTKYEKYDYSIEPDVAGSVVDCVIYYISKDSTGVLRSDIKLELFNSVYERPSYFGLN